MPTRLKRYHHFGSDHFITFSCYRRMVLLNNDQARLVFERTLEHVRRWYGLYIFGYVIMPEHVHLLLSEPQRADLSSAASYQYDAEGHRTKTTVSGTGLEFIYDLNNHHISTVFSSNLNWYSGEVYAGNWHLATYAGPTIGRFVHSSFRRLV